MIDNLFGGDDEDAVEDADEEDIGGLFDDPGDGLDADGEDLSGDGGEDLVGEDDGLGGGDDLGGDDLGGSDLMGGGGDAGGASNSEVTKRLDELENEVDSLSSAVNTVKSENEQLSGSIDDVEENIRKLLEVYEMVTRGVNPFVNEEEFGDAFGGGGGGDSGSMALFGGDEEEAEETADIDESVANADADDFFEDDLEDEAVDDVANDDGVFEEDVGADDVEGGTDDGEGETDDGDDGNGEFEETFDDTGDFDDAGDFDEDAVVDDGDGGGGKSFEDLKSKYETGSDGDGPADDAPADGASAGNEPAGDSLSGSADAVEGDKPYLRAVPGGYAADVVVLEWLEFLVDEAGVDGAARTIAYYEAIEWVSETAAEHLQTYLRGFGDDDVADPEPRSWLTVSHHETSLRFISRIDDPSMGLVAFEDRLERGLPGTATGGDPRGGPATGEAGGHRSGVGSAAASGPELESDGGRRTPEEGGAAYEPAATRRRRGRYGDGDDGEHTCEVGYGGFCWNHEGR